MFSSPTNIAAMSNIKSIRKRLELTQTALAKGLECTQGNIGHYEQGQTMPPDMAKKLIAFAKTLGHVVTFDDIYGAPTDAETGTEATAAGG